tara:strand:- start:264 stop:680 length:417 start_codon:yes stop_codon:yes gene_type:complete
MLFYNVIMYHSLDIGLKKNGTKLYYKRKYINNVQMFHQLQKSPSLYKHAVHNSIYKNALEKSRKEIAHIRLIIINLSEQLQQVTNEILDGNRDKNDLLKHQNLLIKHEQQLRKYIRTVLRKKSLIMKQIADRERVLNR